MARAIYSSRLLIGSVTPSLSQSFTATDGAVTVVREMTFSEGFETLDDALVIVQLVSGSIDVIIGLWKLSAAAPSAQWEGRIVMQGSDELVVSQGDVARVDVTVSGYILSE